MQKVATPGTHGDKRLELKHRFRVQETIIVALGLDLILYDIKECN